MHAFRSLSRIRREVAIPHLKCDAIFVFPSYISIVMAEITHPQSMCNILAGTTIAIAPVGTDESALFIELTCTHDTSVEAWSIDVSKVLSKHFKLPRQCFSLVWDWGNEVRADTESVITVNYILLELTYEKHKSMLQEQIDNGTYGYDCYNCSGPCYDTLTCYRCDMWTRREDPFNFEHLYFCSACMVPIPDKPGRPSGLTCCLYCIEEPEIPVVADQRRLQLLNPNLSSYFH